MFPKRPLTRSLVLSLTLAIPFPLHAIGVGDIDIQSHLNQPLLAQIRILASKSEGIRASDLTVRAASRAQHSKYGLNYPSAMKGAKFQITQQGNGNFLVRATTSYPIKEPLLNFLLEVDWGKGKLYKEVALLLDPPGYQQLPVTPPKPATNPIPATPAPVASQVAETSFDESDSYQPIFTGTPTPATPSSSLGTDVYDLSPEDIAPAPVTKKTTRKTSRKKVARARTQPARKPVLKDGQYGPVRAGDSLSKIARRVAGPGAGKETVKALMDAIYAANPQAFAGSMDALEKGSYLAIPSETDISLGASYLATSAAIGISDFVVTVDGDTDIVIDDSASTPSTPAASPRTEPTASQSEEPAPEPPATVAESPRGELKILPPDETAAAISRRMSERMAALDRKADASQPVTEPVETVDNDPSIAETVTITSDQSSGSKNDVAGSIAALRAEVASLKTERNKLLDRIATAEAKLEGTEEALHRLELKIEALTKALGDRTTSDYGALLAKWLPWLLLPLLPLLIFLAWRKRRAETVDEITPPATPIAPVADAEVSSETPGSILEEEIETVESASRGIDIEALEDPVQNAPSEPTTTNSDISRATPQDTVTMTLGAAPPPDEVQAIASPSVPAAEPGSLDGDLESLLQPALDEIDHTPVASDTQETMRPQHGDAENEATQILNLDAGDDAHLDSAEEAEIYLAYGQFSLAEETINKLLAKDPDNDRHKLLQLKLFAETGRMNELQTLTIDLLQKYPDPDNGMHQQVQNISNQAFTKKAMREQTLSDQDAVPVQSELTQQTPAAVDPTLAQMSVEADKLSATYADDIVDYMSEETLPDLDLASLNENLEETVFEDPLRDTSDTAPSLELDDEDLTDSDLDSLTVDMELRQAKLEIDTEGDDRTVHEDHIEEFSDTDLRLEPINIDDPEPAGDRLDIKFDLESELDKYDTKVNPKDKE